MLNRVLGCVAVLLFIVGLSSPLFAQDVAGITGTVTDKTGLAVEGASVKLTDTRTGTVYETKTGSFGAYTFAKVAPGPGYTLTVSKDNFKTYTISNLYLAIATIRTQDVVLEIGTVTQTVEVKSEGSVSLNTTDSTIGNNFDIRAVESLPNQFRDDVANLLRLQPGVVSAGANSLDDNAASRSGSVTGARTDQSNISVDGIDASDFGGAAFAEAVPTPVDAVQEFRTEVANPLADVGRGSGATSIVTIKSGTNDWHGNAREYHRNTITEANDFFNNKNGVKRPNLIRNQFGGDLGGPIFKDKLFFFFDYDGRRDASQSSVENIVPLDSVRAGGISYINNGPGCTAAATATSAPNCISTLTPAQVTALDPCSNPGTAQGNCTVDGTPTGTPVAPGFNPGILQLFNNRYPRANDLSAGDGINTGGFRFNAPAPLSRNIYTSRVDYNLTQKQKLFVSVEFFNSNGINGVSVQFPGDPITNPLIDRDRRWTIGHTWTFNSNLINQFVYGEARAEFRAVASLTGPANPGGNPGVYGGLNWLFPTGITAPFARPGGQEGTTPVPTFRDDVSWQHGRHSFSFGGVFKPIRTRTSLFNNFLFTNQGLLTIAALDPSLRPANILNDPQGIAPANWDGAFSAFLGIASLQFSVFNYVKNGALQPEGAGARRDYRYYEGETYAQDSWKLRPDLTLTYGLRYGYDSVPYETVGNEAAANVLLGNLLSTRIQNGLNGVSGFNATPLLTYGLAGKANPNAPSLYNPSSLNFAPRVALAWNPGFKDGVLGSLLGAHKTVLRVGAAELYDHTALSNVNFIEDQNNFLFNTVNTFATAGTPEVYLAGSPRFTTIGAPIVNSPAPPFSTSVVPNAGPAFGCSPAVPVCGTANNAFGNYAIDPKFKTPYSYAFTAGVQRELPGNFQLEVDYVGRFAHRLSALADGGQLVDFIDPASKTSLIGAVSTLELEARQNLPVASVQALPFFENQIGAQLGPGGCVIPALGTTNCTQLVYAIQTVPLQQGNTFNVVKVLSQGSLLPPNVGIAPQFISNYYFANKAYSNYQGLIVIVRKRLSQNVQMDFNYTFSHSIDNFSGIANNVGNPFNNAQSVSCDAVNLHTCRGNSEFDVTHQFNGDAIFDLPFGRGQLIGRNSGRLLDELIGGWQVSGLYQIRTGFAFPVLSNASTVTFGNNAYAIFTGSSSAISVNPHTDSSVSNSGIELFSNRAAALAAFSAPTGLQTGARDELRGPHFFNADLALAKNFPLWSEKYKLQFRAEAYNAFNHTNFALPSSINIDAPNFGQITSTSAINGSQAARVLQFALRFQF